MILKGCYSNSMSYFITFEAQITTLIALYGVCLHAHTLEFPYRYRVLYFLNICVIGRGISIFKLVILIQIEMIEYYKLSLFLTKFLKCSIGGK